MKAQPRYEQAGRDPTGVRVWSVLATVDDHIPEEQSSARQLTVAWLTDALRTAGLASFHRSVPLLPPAVRRPGGSEGRYVGAGSRPGGGRR